MTPDTLNKARVAMGAWLARKRRGAGLSQTQLAKLLGQTEAFVNRYEAGGRLEILEFSKIVEILDTKPEEAFKDLSS